MDFSIACQCGAQIVVSEGSAGARMNCNCGRLVEVPSLAKLRSGAGLAPIDVPLEIEVQWLLNSGELPTAECVHCGSSVADVIRFQADCETVYVQKSGGFSWTALILSGGRLFLWDEKVVNYHGRETVIPVPVSMCFQCQRNLLREPPTAKLKLVGTLVLIGGIGALFFGYWSIAVIAAICGLALRVVAMTLQNRQHAGIKQMLSNVPIYQRIFEKYPDAVVRNEGRG